MVAKMTDGGVQFILGEAGAASVNIQLRDVACCALCPKRQGGALKIVAILARATGGRRGSTAQKGGNLPAGELDLICHMFKLKDEATMWAFQQQFVVSLSQAFPKQIEKARRNSLGGAKPPPIHPPLQDILPRGYEQSDFEYDERVNEWVDIKSGVPISELRPGGGARPDMVQDTVSRAKELASMHNSLANDIQNNLSGATKPKQKERPVWTGKYTVGEAETVVLQPYVHKVFVRPTDPDEAMADDLQRQEVSYAGMLKHASKDDAFLARKMQGEEDRKMAERLQRENEVNFDDDDDDGADEMSGLGL
jgi:hypothetical protein